MTRKLYYEDQYMKEFTADIISIKGVENQFHIELNQTCFYPEGGGQPWDLGYIGNAHVIYVYEENGTIFHITKDKPSNAQEVKCVIDWERRWDHMQQHLGQHILSAAFEQLYDTDTVGFHLGNEYTTIDLNKALDHESIIQAEILSNKIIQDNLAVDTLYPAPKELKTLALKKLPAAEDRIRLVKIEDFDLNACCGTHALRTGEIGIIKIRKWENYKGSIRLEFVCGNRAIKDYFEKHDIISNLSVMLSASKPAVLAAVTHLKQELESIRTENLSLKKELLQYKAKDLLNSCDQVNNFRIIKLILEDEDIKDIKLLSSALTANENVIVLAGIRKEEKAQLLFSCSRNISSLNMKALMKEPLELLEGKGGGSQYEAQGGGRNAVKMENALDSAYNAVKSIL